MDTILTMAKTLIGIVGAAEDAKLNILVEDAKQFVKSYCDIEAVPKVLNTTTAKIVEFNYNRLKHSHLQSHTYSNVSETFANNYPNDILLALDKYKESEDYSHSFWCY